MMKATTYLVILSSALIATSSSKNILQDAIDRKYI